MSETVVTSPRYGTISGEAFINISQRAYGEIGYTEFERRMRELGYTPTQALHMQGEFERGEIEFERVAPPPPTYYALVIPSIPNGTTDPPAGGYSFREGEVVSVLAIPDEGYSFESWLLDGNEYTENPISITMLEHHVLEPAFATKYVVVEYTKYYKYLSSVRSKNRHFQITAEFTIPINVDPASVLDMVDYLFDDVMFDLGIEIDEKWSTGWKTGGEATGEETSVFRSRVTSTVLDMLRGYKYDRTIPVTESDVS